MNSVSALAPAEGLQRAASAPPAARSRWRAPRKLCDRRPRPVGRQLQQRRRPGELLAPVGELPLEHLAAAASRAARAAKSAYCTGSAGSGEGRPAAKAA